jgi:competence ComEA-like helix-hairpin-helix protein
VRHQSLEIAMKTLILTLAAAGLVLAADDDDAKRLPDGPGKDVVAQSCLSCHASAYFRRLRLDKDAWTEKVGDMVDRGAKVNDAQAAAIVEYLSQAFGTGAKINVNTAPFEELKAILGLTNQETQAVLAERKEKGRFNTVGELKNISGVDSNKIETKKELITF